MTRVRPGRGPGTVAPGLPRRALRALVPLVLLFATQACAEDSAARSDRVCTDQMMRAVSELSPPPGMHLTFKASTTEDDCVAIVGTDLAGQDVLNHYRSEFAAHGWSDNGSGQMGGISATKNGITLDIEAGGGPDAGLVSFLVYRALATPTNPSTADAPYGVLQAYWPGDVAGATRVLERLRDRLSGQDVAVETSDDDVTAAIEGGASVHVMGDRHADPDTGLAAMASDVACQPDSVAGTAPGISAPGSAGRQGGEVWFSCDVTESGSGPTARGHAVGWTWDRTAWLVVTGGSDAAERLIGLLIEEAAAVHWND